MSNILSKIPLLRFLLPFIIGILFSCTQLQIYIAVGLLICALILYISANRNKTPFTKYKNNYKYSISLFLVVLALGWINAKMLMPRYISTNETKYTTVIACVENIKDNENSMSLTVSIKSYIDSIGRVIEPKPLKALVNIDGNNYCLKVGNIISFTPHFERIRNMGNPDEFDYVSYMKHEGILYTQHIKRSDYSIVGNSHSINAISKRCQRLLINRILVSDISIPAQQFIITALLGDRYILDDDVRSSFSDAGIAHILAVSGLHVGIITIIITFLLYPLSRLNMQRFRLMLTLIILIAYAFITGLSPSVLRATIMAAFFITSYMLYRGNTGLNALCGAALFILIFSPMAIFSVGFQLSFLSVLSILTLSKKLNPFSPKNKIKYYICGLFAVSISAMLGTGIVSAYYFHSFPVLFLLGNVFLIPLLPFVLGVAILYIIFPFQILGSIIDFLYGILIYTVNIIKNIPYSNITNINITTVDIVAYFLIVTLLLSWFKFRKVLWLIISLSTCLIYTIFNILIYNNNEKVEVVIMNNYNETPIIYHEGHAGFIIFPDNNESLDNVKKYNSAFLIKNSIKTLDIVNDSITTKCGFVAKPFMYLCKKRISVINGSDWKVALNGISDKIDVDYLVISKGYYGKIVKLLQCYNPAVIVLSGNIYKDRVYDLQKECKELNIPFHTISKEGALILRY
ncbi:MAG: ComEC/Rec2 family competence protein [Muribaculaceae bacterium]